MVGLDRGGAPSSSPGPSSIASRLRFMDAPALPAVPEQTHAATHAASRSSLTRRCRAPPPPDNECAGPALGTAHCRRTSAHQWRRWACRGRATDGGSCPGVPEHRSGGSTHRGACSSTQKHTDTIPTAIHTGTALTTTHTESTRLGLEWWEAPLPISREDRGSTHPKPTRSGWHRRASGDNTGCKHINHPLKPPPPAHLTHHCRPAREKAAGHWLARAPQHQQPQWASALVGAGARFGTGRDTPSSGPPCQRAPGPRRHPGVQGSAAPPRAHTH